MGDNLVDGDLWAQCIPLGAVPVTIKVVTCKTVIMILNVICFKRILHY